MDDENPAGGGPSPAQVPARAASTAVSQADELPVVARLAIEIRSDGTRTVARGAMHDLASGEQVAIEVNAGSVLELGTQLAGAVGRSLLSLPRLLFSRRRAPRP